MLRPRHSEISARRRTPYPKATIGQCNPGKYLWAASDVKNGSLAKGYFGSLEKLRKVLVPGHQPGSRNHEHDAGGADQYLGEVAAGDLNEDPVGTERQQDAEAEDGKRMLSAQDQRAQQLRGEFRRMVWQKPADQNEGREEMNDPRRIHVCLAHRIEHLMHPVRHEWLQAREMPGHRDHERKSQ